MRADPFPQIVAELAGCAVMGLSATVKDAGRRRAPHVPLRTEDADLPCVLPDPALVAPREIFQSGFAAVLTSFSAWIVSSAHYYYRGEWVDAIFTVLIPGSAFFTLFLIGEDAAFLTRRARLPAAIARPLVSFIAFAFRLMSGLSWVVAAVAAGALVNRGAATHWLSAVLFAPLGMTCRVWIQHRLNRPGVPFGTLLCNGLACLAEALIVVFGGDTGLFLGLIEGFVAALSTVSSVVHEVVHEIDDLHRAGFGRSGIAYLALQVVIGTVLPLIVFAAAGRDRPP